MGTGAMRLLHFVAIRTFRQGWLRQEIVGATSAGAPLGMSSFWIRHCITPYFASRTNAHALDDEVVFSEL
jgi:uncharacterized membrane protein (DUF485 family)